MKDPLLGNQVMINSDIRFCGALQFKDGKIGMRSIERADTVCTRYYATNIGQLQRIQKVAYINGTWVVSSASLARQAALDAISH